MKDKEFLKSLMLHPINYILGLLINEEMDPQAVKQLIIDNEGLIYTNIVGYINHQMDLSSGPNRYYMFVQKLKKYGIDIPRLSYENVMNDIWGSYIEDTIRNNINNLFHVLSVVNSIDVIPECITKQLEDNKSIIILRFSEPRKIIRGETKNVFFILEKITGWTDLDYDQIVEKNKKEIITLLLNTLKADSEVALICVSRMLTDGVKWPELDIIKQSLDSDNLNESADDLLAKIRKDADSLTEKEKIQLVTDKSNAISYIKNPSVEVQMACIMTNPMSIRYIENPDEIIQFAFLKARVGVCSCINNPTEKVQKYAIMHDKWAVTWLQTISKNAAEECKPTIIKNLLELYQLSKLDDVLIMIKTLNGHGIHWDELSTIQKSINSDR